MLLNIVSSVLLLETPRSSSRRDLEGVDHKSYNHNQGFRAFWGVGFLWTHGLFEFVGICPIRLEASYSNSSSSGPEDLSLDALSPSRARRRVGSSGSPDRSGLQLRCYSMLECRGGQRASSRQSTEGFGAIRYKPRGSTGCSAHGSSSQRAVSPSTNPPKGPGLGDVRHGGDGCLYNVALLQGRVAPLLGAGFWPRSGVSFQRSDGQPPQHQAAAGRSCSFALFSLN